MATIINSLEVIVEQPQPPATAAAPSPPSASGSNPPLRPRDLEDIAQRQLRRKLRLTAH